MRQRLARLRFEVASPAVSATPFELVQHLVVVPVRVNGTDTRFVLDSGIGITLISQALCERVGAQPAAATYSGRRMSGQEVTVALAHVDSLAFGGLDRGRAQVGVLDLSGFPAELAHIGGFLSLAFFDEAPFTVDYAASAVVLESAESLAAREAAATEVGVRVERDGPAVTAFCPLVIPSGRTISVEVDMGSDVLILDERFAGEVGVDLDGDGVRRVDGVDETGNRYTRTFGRLAGAIAPPGAGQLAQDAPEVQFQRIIHDGLLGHAFLRRFAVTWDVAGARLLFASPG
jgi:hypothetical protein